MNFLFVILLSATIHQVFCKEKELKCPPGMDLFHRAPTERNNYTSAWCLGILLGNDTYDHDVALSLCANHDSVLSNVENYYEWRHFSKLTHDAFEHFDGLKNNFTVLLAIDGFFNPKCKDFSDERYRKHGGECELGKNLILYQDDNTDPTFVQTQIQTEVPFGTESHNDAFLRFRRIRKTLSECFAINGETPYKANVRNHPCEPVPWARYMGALCGLPPYLG